MNLYLAAKISSFCVANLRNSWLFRAIGALSLNPFAYNLLRPELIRGSLEVAFDHVLRKPAQTISRLTLAIQHGQCLLVEFLATILGLVHPEQRGVGRLAVCPI